MQKTHTIYKITNIVNNKCYIGYTAKENPFDRFCEHISAANGPNYRKQNIHKAINKYGEQNFKFEILYQDSNKEHTFKKKEQELIEQHNALGPVGYNMAKGGGGNGVLSEESRKKMSDAAKGRIPWNKGKKGMIPWNKGLTKKDPRVSANIQKMAETRKKTNSYVPWNKGKTGIYSNDTIQKMSDAARQRMTRDKK